MCGQGYWLRFQWSSGELTKLPLCEKNEADVVVPIYEIDLLFSRLNHCNQGLKKTSIYSSFHVIDFSYGNVSFFVRNPALSFPFLTMKQASAFYELLSKISHQSKSVPSTAPQAPPVQVFYDCDQFPGPLEGQSSPSD